MASGEGTSPIPASRERPPAAAVSLLDVVRILDMDMVGPLSSEELGCEFRGARLACKALRNACDAAVRSVTVRVSQQRAAARAWLSPTTRTASGGGGLTYRSPLALFPRCNKLTLQFEKSKSRSRSSSGQQEPHCSQEQLACLALLGTTPQQRAGITHLDVCNSRLGSSISHLRNSSSSSSRNLCLDLAGVLAVLAPQLPSLTHIYASARRYMTDPWHSSNAVLGMGQLDRLRPGLLFGSLATHAPALRVLVVPCTPGILRGIGALADGCSGLEKLEVYDEQDDAGDDEPAAAVLCQESVEGLSRLSRLQTLRLRCHDPSTRGGAWLLASLLGRRRPPRLRSLWLVASVATATDDADDSDDDEDDEEGRTQLPDLDIAFEHDEREEPPQQQGGEQQPEEGGGRPSGRRRRASWPPPPAAARRSAAAAGRPATVTAAVRASHGGDFRTLSPKPLDRLARVLLLALEQLAAAERHHWLQQAERQHWLQQGGEQQPAAANNPSCCGEVRLPPLPPRLRIGTLALSDLYTYEEVEVEDIQQENEWVTEQLQRYLTRQGAALPRLLAHADAPAAVECDCLHDLRAVSPETAHGLLRVLGVLPSVLGLRLGHCRPGTLRLGRDAHSAAADSSDDETAAAAPGQM